ncbi:MAG TPA: hypothetical protein VJ770_24305 [Stellaceae bacterium]|nr:hypothetical protein [Stellaceae bacterium]
MTGIGSEAAGVIIDDMGKLLPPHPLYLAQRLGCPTGDFDVITHAVRNLGFVSIAPVRGALLVKFEPATVRRLAAIAAFYEIAGRAPKRLILACPGKAGHPDRYEIFQDLGEGLRRLEAALEGRRDAPAEPAGQAPAGRGRGKSARAGAKGGRVASLWRPDGLAIRQQAGNFSQRLFVPLDEISPQDAWLAQLLGIWRDARSGWRLPANESLDPLEVLNIARGRAHIVDTRETDPAAYRFRLWGTVNSYGSGHANRTLAQMPTGLMRENAIEDYWEAVTTGVPAYQLVYNVENDLPYSYARLLLPLAADGRRVDQLLVLINERALPELGSLETGRQDVGQRRE